MKKKPAVFLDRDGTINEDVGNLFEIAKLKFIPGSVEALRMLQNKFMLFIITNQSGIGAGAFTEKQYSDFQSQYNILLKKEGINIIETLHCPHRADENCICRKPSISFIKMLSEKYHIDLKSSYTVGDHPGDVEMGDLAGCHSIFLLSGHGRKHLNEIKTVTDYIADDLYKAALYILSLN